MNQQMWIRLFFILFAFFITIHAQAQPGDTTIYTVTDSMPLFPGGTEALKKYLAEHTRYPVSGMEKEINGKVYIRFVVEKDGTLSGFQAVKEIAGERDFTVEALRVARSMPFWFPAYNKGLPVRCYMYIPVKFVSAPKPAHRDTLSRTDYAPLVNPEVQAMFPGGDPAMKKYLDSNLVYPRYCLETEAKGTVYISAMVETDGSLTEIKVEKGIKECPDLAKEALRLVKNMPRWIPGTYNGTVVRMKMNIPVRFVLR